MSGSELSIQTSYIESCRVFAGLRAASSLDYWAVMAEHDEGVPPEAGAEEDTNPLSDSRPSIEVAATQQTESSEEVESADDKLLREVIHETPASDHEVSFQGWLQHCCRCRFTTPRFGKTLVGVCMVLGGLCELTIQPSCHWVFHSPGNSDCRPVLRWVP